MNKTKLPVIIFAGMAMLLSAAGIARTEGSAPVLREECRLVVNGSEEI